MRVLFLVQNEQRVILDRLYEGVAKNSDCDIRRLSSSEQDRLRSYFKKHVDVDKYDRVVIFLRTKKIFRQVPFIKTIPNLVFLEHDACQNYIESKYRGRLSKFYKKLPWARVISSGELVTQRLREEGIDSVFVPKGFDQELLKNMQQERDIELGFVGSVKSSTYSKRREFLERLSKVTDLQVKRTKSGEEYLKTLNRIRFFVSADIGLDEYMIKNFEAMACGCVLFSYDQGDQENQALGFKDMDNIVLYNSIENFQERLEILRADTTLASKIAWNGQRLAEEYYSFSDIGRRIVKALEPELRSRPEPTLWLKVISALGR